MGTTNLNGLRGTIPVRGRKLHLKAIILRISRTIPVRGRKLNIVISFLRIFKYHPRKGAKTRSLKYFVIKWIVPSP